MFRKFPNQLDEKKIEDSNRRRSRRLQQTESKRLAEAQKRYVGENHQIDIDDVKIDNPYKTKNTAFSKDLNPNKQQEKLQRPTFAKHVNSYELDLMFFNFNKKMQPAIYLVLININTRFAHIVLIPDKSTESVKRAISKLIYYGTKITNIRYDGELALESQDMKDFWNLMNVNFCRSTSKYTNKTRIVDRFIRTLRDLYFNTVGDKSVSFEKQHDILQQLVTIYNNTEHSSIGMKPAEMTYADEYKYIETMTKMCNVQRQKQVKEGLFNLKYGDKIKIYLDGSKTQDMFAKKRGNYIHDATFIEYSHGNVICLFDNRPIEIPIYWVKPQK